MNSDQSVIVLGAGGHAKVVISTLRLMGFEIAGVYDDCAAKWDQEFFGYRVLGPLKAAADSVVSQAIIAIGDNAQRRRIAASLQKNWLTVVHPQAVVSPAATLGPGSFVAAGAVIQADAKIGAHCIVNTSATVDHDCQVEDFAHVCCGACLAGGVSVGKGAFVGAGATVIPGVSIGEDGFIAAGACVTQSVPAKTRVMGVPARLVTKTVREISTPLGPRRLFLSPPHMSGRERDSLIEAFESNWIAPLGPQVNAFEKEFADAVGMDHAVALSSGTAALHLALKLLEVSSGDRVFTSSLTFAATVNAIDYVGATPVFIDSDVSTWNMDPDLLGLELERAAKAGNLPQAIVVVDVYGQCADYDPILQLAPFYEVPVIEDAAEALGAEYHGRPAGTFGDIACFSFNGNKIITTSGGGMLVTQKKAWAERARYLASQARQPAAHYEHTEVGFNYRMSNLLAAIGRKQLQVLEQRVNARRNNFEYYREFLSDLPGLTFMPEPENCRSTRWLTCVLIDPAEFGATREDVRVALEAENIESRPVWKPMHLQPAFQHHRMVGGRVAEAFFRDGLCLPSGSSLTQDDLRRIVKIVRQCHFNNALVQRTLAASGVASQTRH